MARFYSTPNSNGSKNSLNRSWAIADGQGTHLRLIIEIKSVSFDAGLLLTARGTQLRLIIEIKSLSFAAGLFLMARGYSTPTYN